MGGRRFLMGEVPLYLPATSVQGSLETKDTHSLGVLYSSKGYRGTSLIRNNPTPVPYSRPIPRALWWSWGGGGFL